MKVKDHLSRIAELGCIACRKMGHYGTPAEIHHIRETAGMGQKSSDREAIPLCANHHRGLMHPHVPSVHLDRKVFIQTFGNELQLLQEVAELLKRN